jgi:aspartyl-tRNA(Asn)/glutamyl-tRNA(Gln) amidotransferase subunit B
MATAAIPNSRFPVPGSRSGFSEATVTPWEPVIGLEVHVQLATASKAFSSSAVAFGAPPNSLVDPTVLGLPGALPVFNARALELALRLGVAVGSRIRAVSRFARKHYFYPDQPKGYQISQYDEPLCEGGVVDVIASAAGAGELCQVALTRIHLEEDAGKTIHAGLVSTVDLDRAGVPLVEVVTDPVIGSADDAADFMRSLHRLVRWLEVSEADMEKGQLRCDANVSIRPRGSATLGTRTELKNINSFRFVHHAIEHEIARQVRIVEAGGRVERETRLWDAELGQSAPLRSKEEANDYRYFPDPDLPPLAVPAARIDSVRAALPELPSARFARYQRELAIPADDARTLVGDRALAEFFDAGCAKLAAAAKTGRMLASWLLVELIAALRADGRALADSPVTPAGLAGLVDLIDDGTLSGKLAKEVFAEAYRSREMPAEVASRRGLKQISDPAELSAVIDRVLSAHPTQVETYRAGKEQLLGFFVGAVMKATTGRANPAATTALLRERLKK